MAMMTMSNLKFNISILLRWNADKGYGFTEYLEHKCGIFVHITAFEHHERNPIVGDTIIYQLAVGKENKLRAIDAYLKGVKRVPKIVVDRSQKEKIVKNYNRSNKYSKSSYNNNDRSVIEQVKSSAIIITASAIITLGFILCYESYKSIAVSPPPITTSATLRSIHGFANPKNFKCDGRIYCTQINSREEARFLRIIVLESKCLVHLASHLKMILFGKYYLLLSCRCKYSEILIL